MRLAENFLAVELLLYYALVAPNAAGVFSSSAICVIVCVIGTAIAANLSLSIMSSTPITDFTRIAPASLVPAFLSDAINLQTRGQGYALVTPNAAGVFSFVAIWVIVCVVVTTIAANLNPSIVSSTPVTDITRVAPASLVPAFFPDVVNGLDCDDRRKPCEYYNFHDVLKATVCIYLQIDKKRKDND